MAEVSKWYLENDVGALKKQTGFNSYVAPSADHELQVDLFEFKYKQPIRHTLKDTVIDGKVYNLGKPIARSLNHVAPYGIIGINTFAKKVHVVPAFGETARDHWKPAMKEIIKELGKPEVIYTDPDASLDAIEMKEWFNKNKIRNVITRQHAAVAERAIRTIKKRLDDKLKSDDVEYPDKDPASYWTKHIGEVVEWYNSHVQANTNMKPEDAENLKTSSM